MGQLCSEGRTGLEDPLPRWSVHMVAGWRPPFSPHEPSHGAGGVTSWHGDWLPPGPKDQVGRSCTDQLGSVWEGPDSGRQVPWGHRTRIQRGQRLLGAWRWLWKEERDTCKARGFSEPGTLRCEASHLPQLPPQGMIWEKKITGPSLASPNRALDPRGGALQKGAREGRCPPSATRPGCGAPASLSSCLGAGEFHLLRPLRAGGLGQEQGGVNTGLAAAVGQAPCGVPPQKPCMTLTWGADHLHYPDKETEAWRSHSKCGRKGGRSLPDTWGVLLRPPHPGPSSPS